MVTVAYSVDIYRYHHAFAAPAAVKLGGDRLLQEGTDNPTSARGNSDAPGSKKAQQWRKGAAGPSACKSE